MSVWAHQKPMFVFLGPAHTPGFARLILIANFELTGCMGLQNVAHCTDCAELTGQIRGAICWHMEETTKNISYIRTT